MQLLYEDSNENGLTKGLGIFTGNIQKFDELDAQQQQVSNSSYGLESIVFYTSTRMARWVLKKKIQHMCTLFIPI